MTDPNGPPLSRTMFDRAALHRTDDEWLDDAWRRAKVVLISPGSATPVDAEGHMVFRESASTPDGIRRFLGVVDDVPYFTVTAESDTEGWRTLREVGAQVDDLEGALLVSAIGLEQWHQRHGYCPRCGATTVESQAGWTRVCTNDGSQHFPRTDPAVIMLIHDGGDRALLGRGPQWGPGRFSTLAGFVEPGESLEAAVAREVFEEVGVAIRDIRYLASQPWPFPASLMLGFVARLDGDPSITLDPVEMAEAGWFTRDEVRRAADRTDGRTASDDADDTNADDTNADDTNANDTNANDTGVLRGISPHFSISRYLIDRWLDRDL